MVLIYLTCGVVGVTAYLTWRCRRVWRNPKVDKKVLVFYSDL